MKLKISTKTTLGFLFILVVTLSLSLFSAWSSREFLKGAIGQNTIFLAEDMLERMNYDIYLKIESFHQHAKDTLVRDYLGQSNAEFEALEDTQEFINLRDLEWVSVPKNKVIPIMSELINNELSKNLREKFIELEEKKYGYRTVEEIILTNKFGANIAITQKTSDYYQADEGWWQTAKEKGAYISSVEFDESVGKYTVAIAIRIDNNNGEFIGVTKAVISLRGIIKEAEATSKKYETTEIKVVTNSGKLIYSSKTFQILDDLSSSDFFKNIKHTNGYFITTEGGREKLYSYAHSRGFRDFTGLRWILLISHDTQEVLRPALILKNNILITSLILIIVAALIIFLIVRSISRPINKLMKSVQEIGNKNLDVIVDVDSSSDIGKLAGVINQMTKDLKKSSAEIEDYNKDLESQIATRTRELNSKIEELEGFNKLAIGREIAMVELKKRIKELEENLRDSK